MVKKSLKNTGAFQLKITLDNSKPPIWRRVLVPNNFTLHDLHLVIQASFNWFNYHLYGFNLSDKQAVDSKSGQWDGLEDYQVDSKTYLVKDVISEPKMRLVYEYDFGDGWRHIIELEKILDENLQNPKLIKESNYAPVEDCGGIWGWYDKLDFLKNYPKKPSADDKELLNWMVDLIPELDETNPRTFDPSVVNFDEIAERS